MAYWLTEVMDGADFGRSMGRAVFTTREKGEQWGRNRVETEQRKRIVAGETSEAFILAIHSTTYFVPFGG